LGFVFVLAAAWAGLARDVFLVVLVAAVAARLGRTVCEALVERAARPPEGRARWSATGDRGQHGHLVVGADRRVGLGGLAVHPHPAAGEQGGEGLAIALPGRVEDLADGGAGNLVVGGARRLPGRREQPQRGQV
jgi:hypothetical protein